MRDAVEDIKTEIMKEADNPISEIKKEIEKVKEKSEEMNPIADLKKTTEDLKNKINPLEDDSYEGPVSR